MRVSSLVTSVLLKCEEQFSAQREVEEGAREIQEKGRWGMVDGGSSGAVVLNMWFWTDSINITWELFWNAVLNSHTPYLLDQKLGRWNPAMCVFVINLLTIYWVVNCCNHYTTEIWDSLILILLSASPWKGNLEQNHPKAQRVERRHAGDTGRWEGGSKTSVPKLDSLGTHTHSTGKDQGVPLFPVNGHEKEH